MSISLARARSIVSRFPRQKILVVGDLMLDHYIYGHVSRISPEAPVPVVHVRREHSMPGGACNVAANVRALGGSAAVAGVIGRDLQGRRLLSLLRDAEIGTEAVLPVAGRPTTVKTRVVAERQQVVRVDWEKPANLTPQEIRAFSKRLAKAFDGVSAVVIEDYGKGVLTQEVVDIVMRQARSRNIPVGLDPKENYALRFDGLTVAKPNRKEAFAHAGLPDPGAVENPAEDPALLEAAERLLQKWNPRLLMITLGAQGMLLAEPGKTPRHVPTRAREVFDLSGAGDTVIATCMLAIGAGADFISAAELANYAAGVVVGKLGTATCSKEELLEYIAKGPP